MKRAGTTKVIRRVGDAQQETGTDWTRVAELTQEEIHSAAEGDPDAQPLPRDRRGMTHVPNVKKLREKVGLTQEAFAQKYRIPLGTLRDWEQRRKFPDAPARAYLQVIARNPEAVAELLRGAA